MTKQQAIKILRTEYLGDSEEMESAKYVGASVIEKQIPEKVVEAGWVFCPNCDLSLDPLQKASYCHHCGQALNWS